MKKTLVVLIGFIVLALVVALRFKGRDPQQPTALPAQADNSVHPQPDQPQVGASQRKTLTSSPVPDAAGKGSPSGVLKRMLAGDTNVYKLPLEQIGRFIARNRTNAESLLVAFEVTADPEFLQQAKRL